MKKLIAVYHRWKEYIQVDLLMYGVMILFIILLFVFFA
jgi:hypothetical protein